MPLVPEEIGAHLRAHTPPGSGASRADSFEFAFAHFLRARGARIVELGTIRSYVHGGLPGCNEDDRSAWDADAPERWDWGAGCFSLVAALSLGHTRPRIDTVDVVPAHVERCRLVTARFSELFHYEVADSVDFLRGLAPRSIDLLYLDTGDVWPIEPSARHQLKEAEAAWGQRVLRPGALVLIDDVRSPVPLEHGAPLEHGKSAYALPYLLERGFEIVFDGYQVALAAP